MKTRKTKIPFDSTLHRKLIKSMKGDLKMEMKKIGKLYDYASYDNHDWLVKYNGRLFDIYSQLESLEGLKITYVDK